MKDIDLNKLKKLAGDAIDLGGIANYRKGAEAVSAFKDYVTPATIMALIERLEAAEIKCERWKEESISAHEENESITAELARRDAAAGEPVAWAHRLINRANAVAGTWVYGSAEREPTEGALFRVEVMPLYTAAQTALLSPEKVVKLPSKFNPCISSLGLKVIPAMKLTAEGGWVNLSRVKAALDEAGVKYE